MDLPAHYYILWSVEECKIVDYPHNSLRRQIPQRRLDILPLLISIVFFVSSFSYGSGTIQAVMRFGGVTLVAVTILLSVLVMNRVIIRMTPIVLLLICYSLVGLVGSSESGNYLLGYWKSIEIFILAMYLLYLNSISNQYGQIVLIRTIMNTLSIILLVSISFGYVLSNNQEGLNGYIPIINSNSVGAFSAILSVFYFWEKKYTLVILFASILFISTLIL